MRGVSVEIGSQELRCLYHGFHTSVAFEIIQDTMSSQRYLRLSWPCSSDWPAKEYFAVESIHI
jgi:hypothetical protein